MNRPTLFPWRSVSSAKRPAVTEEVCPFEGPSAWIRVRARYRDRRTPIDPFRSRWRFLPTRTRWSSARRLPLTECYDGSRLRNLVDIPGIGRHEQPVVQERERVVGRIVEGHVKAAGHFEGFREPGMRGRCLLEPKLQQCRQPVRSVRRETPCDRVADFVEPQRRQERAYRFIHDRSA